MRLVALCLLTSAFAYRAPAQDGSSPVVVVTPGKNWSAEGKGLSRSQKLAPGAPLDQKGTAAESSDLILDCGSAGWLAYTCGKLPCAVHACQAKGDGLHITRVDLATKGESDSGGESWFSSLFRREPTTLAVLGVREGGHITDAVVPLTGAEVHLGPALKRVLEGTYCFRMTALPISVSSEHKQASLVWDRSVDAEGKVLVAGLGPGLYQIEKSASDGASGCTFESDAIPAWILIAKESDFPALDKRWKEITTRARDLENNGASPTILMTVRHAALAHLADSAQQDGK